MVADPDPEPAKIFADTVNVPETESEEPFSLMVNGPLKPLAPVLTVALKVQLPMPESVHGPVRVELAPKDRVPLVSVKVVLIVAA